MDPLAAAQEALSGGYQHGGQNQAQNHKRPGSESKWNDGSGEDSEGHRESDGEADATLAADITIGPHLVAREFIFLAAEPVDGDEVRQLPKEEKREEIPAPGFRKSSPACGPADEWRQGSRDGTDEGVDRAPFFHGGVDEHVGGNGGGSNPARRVSHLDPEMHDAKGGEPPPDDEGLDYSHALGGERSVGSALHEGVAIDLGELIEDGGTKGAGGGADDEVEQGPELPAPMTAGNGVAEEGGNDDEEVQPRLDEGFKVLHSTGDLRRGFICRYFAQLREAAPR